MMKKDPKWVAGTIIFIILVVIIANVSTPKDVSVTRQSTVIESVAPKTILPEESVTPASSLTCESVTNIINGKLGETTSEGLELVKSVILTPYEGQTINVSVVIRGGIAWDAKGAIDRDCYNIKNLAQVLHETYQNIGYLQVTVIEDLTDKYGNTSEGDFLRIGFTQKTLKLMNFDNITPDDLPKAADDWWVLTE